MAVRSDSPIQFYCAPLAGNSLQTVLNAALAGGLRDRHGWLASGPGFLIRCFRQEALHELRVELAGAEVLVLENRLVQRN